MKEFRLIIAGSRSFNDYMLLEQTCDYLLAGKVKAGYSITIVSGTANGADTLGEQYAARRGFNVVRMPADWNRFGKAAGYRRNVAMAEYAMQLGSECGTVVFWDSKSPGTKHMVNISLDKNIKCVICEYLKAKGERMYVAKEKI
jgi:hypothetical protein